MNGWSNLMVKRLRFVESDSTWGVQVLRSPNFFLGEWKQIET